MSLVVTDLRKRYGAVVVLRGVSFECNRGDVCALTGENGSGKSTILSILAGLIPADGGGAELEGASLTERNSAGRRQLGFVPEKANPPAHMSGEQLLGLVTSLKSSERPSEERLIELGIDQLLRRPIGGLSLGQRRRLCIAVALIGEPSLLILDEPTNGLDRDGAEALRDIIAAASSRDVAVLVATHDRELIEKTGARELHLEAGLIV